MTSHDFDFLESGQAIQNAREKQRITREELAEEPGVLLSSTPGAPDLSYIRQIK